MKPEHNSEDLDFSRLGSFQSIDPESDWTRVTQRISFERNRSLKKRYRAMAWRLAASILAILGVGYLSQQYFFSPGEMITVHSGDKQELVQLPDGSKVTLNSNSHFFYPEKFRGGERNVKLSGEAYFEVLRNSGKPFMVTIEDQAVIEVLGTSFNIRSNPEEKYVSVLVIEGRVAFKDASNKNPDLILEKDQQATLTGGILKRDDAVNKNMLGWKTGILSFDQSFIGDVVKQLEIYYRKEILLDEGIPLDLKITSTFDNQDLESVLEELSLVLGLSISHENDLIIISTQL